jgi:hypothetical protein
MIQNQLLISLLKQVGIVQVVFVEYYDCWLEPLVDIPTSERRRKHNYTRHALGWKPVNAVEICLLIHMELKLLENCGCT